MNRLTTYLVMLTSFLILAATGLQSQQKSIRLIDPHGMSRTSKATMDSLTVIIKPEGAYTQISYLINISTEGTQFNSIYDTVEIESFFQLPENAIVNDSWLWVEDTLVYADIIDRWTASKIYEDIVKRFRRDPSLFLKNSPVNYEFRLYPLAGTTYRKFLISMLIPNSIEDGKFKIEVPDIWFSLVNYPNTVSIIFKDDEVNKDISYQFSNSEYEFTLRSTEFFGDHQYCEINTVDFLSNKNFVYTGSIAEDIHLSKFKMGSEQFFQMSLNTNKFLAEKESVRHLILFEYVRSTALGGLQETVNTFINQLTETYSSGDEINILFSDKLGVIRKLSPKWINMNADGKDFLLSKRGLMESEADDLTSLRQLINEAINQINSNGDEQTSIVIFASSDGFGENNAANALINHISRELKYPARIYAMDFARSNLVKNYHINNIIYRGNEYLYYNLARMSQGEYLNVWSHNNSIPAMFKSFANYVFTKPENLNYLITTNDGFAYHFFEVQNNNQTLTLVGKYIGGDEFNIRITYMLGNEPRFKEIKLDKEHIKDNRRLPQIWIGNHLKYLESISNPNNRQIRDIIDLSIQNRVLSRYTAFLALEPWMRDSIFGGNSNDEVVVLDVKEKVEVLVSELKVSSYPNPARENVTITVYSPIPSSISAIEIYDMSGRRIKTLPAPTIDVSGELNLQWELTDEYGNKVKSGIYYIIVQIGIRTFNSRIVVVR